MKIEPVGDRVVLRRLKLQSTLISEVYTHFCEVVEKSIFSMSLKVGDIVIEPERWTQVPDSPDLIVAKTKHISAIVRK